MRLQVDAVLRPRYGCPLHIIEALNRAELLGSVAGGTGSRSAAAGGFGWCDSLGLGLFRWLCLGSRDSGWGLWLWLARVCRILLWRSGRDRRRLHRRRSRCCRCRIRCGFWQHRFAFTRRPSLFKQFHKRIRWLVLPGRLGLLLLERKDGGQVPGTRGISERWGDRGRLRCGAAIYGRRRWHWGGNRDPWRGGRGVG